MRKLIFYTWQCLYMFSTEGWQIKSATYWDHYYSHIWFNPLILAEDPSAFGSIYILKFLHNCSYFIWKVRKNTSFSCGNTNSASNISCYWNCAGPITPNHWLAAHGPVWNCWLCHSPLMKFTYIIVWSFLVDEYKN